MKYVKDPKPLSTDEVPGMKRAVELLGEELRAAMGRKRRSILSHTRKFLLALLPKDDEDDV